MASNALITRLWQLREAERLHTLVKDDQPVDQVGPHLHNGPLIEYGHAYGRLVALLGDGMLRVRFANPQRTRFGHAVDIRPENGTVKLLSRRT